MMLGRVALFLSAAVALSACSSSNANNGDPNGSGGGPGDGNGSQAGSGNVTTPDGLVISHSDDGNDCTTWYGKAPAKTFIPAEPGPCPARTAVVCGKCENEYPIVTFTEDGIRYRDEIFSRASVAACVSWAEGSARADECVIERDGKFTAVAAGVGGPSGLQLPTVVPGTITEGLGPWGFSLLGFKVQAGAVKLTDCANYYGDGVTDDLRWRGDTVPCPDANRTRTAPRPFADGVTAEYVIYAD